MHMICQVLPVPARRRAQALLAFTFLFGHFLGVCFSGSASDLFLPAMRAAVSSRVSIIGLLSCGLLPFLISAFAVYLGQPVFLFPIAFAKAFLFSFTGYRLVLAWGSAGWLITGLTMFSSVLSMPVLCWYWLRCIGRRGLEWSVFWLVLVCLLAIGLVDRFWIMPFLVSIISF